MTDTAVIGIALQAMLVAAKLAGPILIVALVIGFAVSVFQSATQIQEVTLSFVPKVVGAALVMLLMGKWMLNSMVSFTTRLFDQLPSLLSGG
jgi:flagellar biosynthetic protein FliQ